MVDFTSVLDVPMDSIEKPKPIPTGTYFAQVVGVPKVKDATVQGEEQQIVEFSLKLTSAKAVDSQDQLDAFGDVGAARPVQRAFFFHKPPTPEELWAFSQFAKNTLMLETAGKSFKQVCAEAVGKQLLVTVGQRLAQNKAGEMEAYPNVTGTAPV